MKDPKDMVEPEEMGPTSESTNVEELWDYIPEDIFPKDATIKGRHKYLRHTEWKGIDRYNENNKAIVEETVKSYKRDHPELKDLSTEEILIKYDDIWSKYCLFDNIMYESLKNKDYILDQMYKGDESHEYGHIREWASNYDVLFDFTLGGYACPAYIVFNIQYQHTYGSEEEWDDYAIKTMEEWNNNNRIYNGKPMSYDAFNVMLYKQGHCKFYVKDYGKEYRMSMRRVERHNSDVKVCHSLY